MKTETKEAVKFCERNVERNIESACSNIGHIRRRLNDMLNELERVEARFYGKLDCAEGYTLTDKDRAKILWLAASEIGNNAEVIARQAREMLEQSSVAHQCADMLATITGTL